MTNTLALGLGALILGLLALDYALHDWTYVLFLGSRFIDLIDWLAFWR